MVRYYVTYNDDSCFFFYPDINKSQKYAYYTRVAIDTQFLSQSFQISKIDGLLNKYTNKYNKRSKI